MFLKLDQIARKITFLSGIEFRGPLIIQVVIPRLLFRHQAPPNRGIKSSDFTLNLDLGKENTYRNKFTISGNNGDWLWYSSGSYQ